MQLTRGLRESKSSNPRRRRAQLGQLF